MKSTIKVSVILLVMAFGCNNDSAVTKESNELNKENIEPKVEAETFVSSSSDIENPGNTVRLSPDGWLEYKVEIPTTGRYNLQISMKGDSTSNVWFEDYINNTDERTYDISGAISNNGSDQLLVYSKDGSPLKAGLHEIKLHARGGNVEVDWFKFELMKEHKKTPVTFTQNMEGNEWELVWSDEFNGSGLPDTSKWSYNIGDWGWGNNEPQYYTENRLENARQENGSLIIEAHQNDMGSPWTSARLTTQGKEAFLYGRIEFRAKVPVGRGTWAAGWLLGDAYEDELSWPYCGEIDVLECVGYEIDDETEKGLNHATCHTRAYYFKQNNQIGSQIEVENMNSEFHTYAIEWYPDAIHGYLDGEKYYTYDKNKDELEWPFHQAQNIIVNLAVGGGWGGAQGIDESWKNHQFILDYVRVYQLK